MSYEKFYPNGWQSGETGGTPITPEALNHMEQGIMNSAPAEYVKKTYFEIPAGGAASIAFSGTANSMIYCRGWSGGLVAVFNYSGYAANASRQNLVTLVNDGLVACGLNKDSAGQGLTIKNNHSTTKTLVCIDSGLQDSPPVITYTESNAAELYVEYPNPPMALGVEYRTTIRWNGKVVYTKLVNYGGMPNNNVYAVSHGASATNILRCLGTVISTGENFPSPTVDVFAGKTHISINTTVASPGQAYVQIWYTKD